MNTNSAPAAQRAQADVTEYGLRRVLIVAGAHAYLPDGLGVVLDTTEACSAAVSASGASDTLTSLTRPNTKPQPSAAAEVRWSLPSAPALS